VSARTGLDTVAKSKNPFNACQEMNPGRPARVTVTILTIESRE